MLKIIRIMPALCLVVGIVLSSPIKAALIDRGNGLIYDDILDVTWLNDASVFSQKLSWSDASVFAADFQYQGLDEWRLPSLLPSEISVSNAYHLSCGSGRFNMDNSGCDIGWTSSSLSHELAYMFYVNLGNRAGVDSNGNWQAGGGLENTVAIDSPGQQIDFSGLTKQVYWYGTEFTSTNSFYFAMQNGIQFHQNKDDTAYVWLLHDGDVAMASGATPVAPTVVVSEPELTFLSLIGLLICLVCNRQRIRQPSVSAIN